MQAYMAGIPYVEGFKKKLESIATAEGFYEYTMYLVCSMLNVYARTQVKVWSSESRQACLNGRVVTIFHTWDLSTPVATPQTYECRIARPRSTKQTFFQLSTLTGLPQIMLMLSGKSMPPIWYSHV